EKLLDRLPSRFELTVPNDSLPPFASSAPFFMQDKRMSFFIQPRGRYVGGFADPDLGLTLGSNNQPIPLELPDTVTFLLAERVMNQRNTTLAAPSENVANPGEVTTGTTAAIAHTALFSPATWEATSFRFYLHEHPFVCLLIEELNRYGIPGILRPDPEKEQNTQRKAVVKSLKRQERVRTFFPWNYDPTDAVSEPYPKLTFDFNYGAPYATYNWELFFHAPLMLAQRLSGNQQFAKAQQWFHYLFDPTYRPPAGEVEAWPQRVWQIKPFFEEGIGTHIQRTMLLLKSSGLTNEEREERNLLNRQIDAWRNDPFNPHLIARLRPQAYMKATIMAYLDHLIAWGDHLFAQDAIESINEATQLYLMAQDILGDRPRSIPALEETAPTINGEEVRTFNDLRGRLDAFSNALVELEMEIEPDTSPGHSGGLGGLAGGVDSFSFAGGNDSDGGGGLAPNLSFTNGLVGEPDPGPVGPGSITAEPILAVMTLGPSLFFCIPKNDQLLRYWDTVEDRLFKIRHCMNIAGVTRQLALFQPAIDPGALVQAAAAGLGVGDVLASLQAPLPHYRFQTMLQKANEILNDVKALGSALLSALEKKDAEELAILRATHEVSLYQSMRAMKEKMIDEAKEHLASIRAAKFTTQFRYNFYNTLVEEGLIAQEEEQQEKLEKANQSQQGAEGIQIIKSVFAAMPNFDIGINGAFGTPEVVASWGGTQLASVADAGSQIASIFASVFTYDANKASINAGNERRKQEWEFQRSTAELELIQLDKQIASAEIRVDIAKADLESHDRQIKNAQEVTAYLTNKYTQPALYQWMVSQINGAYYQSYQMAFQQAKLAERTYQHELGINASDTNFIQFGHWDSMKKGLLAGEKLQMDVRKLELAYLEHNKREFELTKHISLRQLNPFALLQLKAT
ncbi:MAG: hypothetical protein AAF840_10135, partial [Bacteroidota bacterium]